MSRRLREPKHQLQGEQTIRIPQDSWRGMWNDLSPSEIPADATHLLINSDAYPKDIRPRPGVRRFFPALIYPKTTKYGTFTSASRAGNVVTVVGGTITAQAVGHYFVWGSDGQNHQITSFLTSTTFTTRQSGTRATDSSVGIRENIYGDYWDRRNNRLFHQIGDRLFFSDNTFAAWTEIPSITGTKLGYQKSRMYNINDDIIIMNHAGIFRVIMRVEDPYYFKINFATPVVWKETDVIETDQLTFGRRRLYTFVRMRNTVANKDRSNGGILEQESGPNKSDARSDGGRYDFSQRFTEFPVGDGTRLYGILIGGALTTTGIDPATYKAISQPGGFGIAIDTAVAGVPAPSEFKDIAVDFTDVVLIADVAAAIQRAIRSFFPNATCEVKSFGSETDGSGTIASRFVFTSGTSKAGSISKIEKPTAAGVVDITTLMNMGIASTQKIDNAQIVDKPDVAEFIKVPGEKHWTHYGVYGTRDIGDAGTDVLTGIGNNPENYFWEADLPLCVGVLVDSITSIKSDKLTLVFDGEEPFKQFDIGNAYKLSNGVFLPIQKVTNNSPVGKCTVEFENLGSLLMDQSSISDDGTGGGETTGAIQGNLAFKAIKDDGAATGPGKIVEIKSTSSSKTTFVAADVGEPIFWQNGEVDVIISVAAGKATVHQAGEFAVQGAGVSAQTRKFNDTVNDETLALRRDGGLILRNRFFQPLPNPSGDGVVVPGFIVVTRLNDTFICYSMVPRNYPYIGGYHNPGYQFDDSPKDTIQRLRLFPNRLVVYCSNSTWATPTNISEFATVEEIGEAIAVLRQLELQEDKGTLYVNAVARIDTSIDLVITNEPAVRLFDGFRYGDEDLSYNKVRTIIQTMSRRIVGHYNPAGGYHMWGAIEEDA